MRKAGGLGRMTVWERKEVILRRMTQQEQSRSGAAVDQVVGDLAEAGGAGSVRFKLGDGVGGEFVGDLMGTFEAMYGGVGSFLLGDVFAGGFAEGGGGFFDVEDVVCHLK